LRLPENEPVSSMMPGKVDPTQVEALTMACAQGMGRDVAIGIGAGLGQFELNVYEPLIAYDMLDSLRLLSDAMASFSAHCIEGIEANAVRIQALVESSSMLVTALASPIGRDRAAAIAKHAPREGVSLRQAALSVGGVSGSDFDRWVDPRRILGAG
jgi:fumarate hydratase, class II